MLDRDTQFKRRSAGKPRHSGAFPAINFLLFNAFAEPTAQTYDIRGGTRSQQRIS